MLDSGNFIVPTFNYELRTDKPPLHYYFIILAYKLFDVNEFSARFFSSIFGSFTVLLTFYFSKKVFGLNIAILSALILLSSLHFVFQFHMAVPDPYLIFFINLSFFSFYLYYKFADKRFIWLFYIGLGFGVLSKGIVAFILPFGIISTFLLILKVYFKKDIPDLNLLPGLFLILLISLPWYIAVAIETKGLWLKEFLLTHNISRFTEPMEGHGGIFLITFLFVFIGMLPFSIFISNTIKEFIKNKTNADYLYLVLIVVIYTTFFSISKTKLPNYTVPVYPALSILLALTLQNMKNYKTLLIFYALLTSILPFALYLIVSNDKNIYLLSNYSFYFFILTVGSVIALIFYKDLKKVVLSLFLSSIAMSLALYFIILPEIDKQSSVKVILPYIDKTKPVGYYKRYNPAFSFYLQKRIIPLNSPEEVENFLKNGKVYILTRDDYIKELENIKELKIIAKKKDLFENPISVLLSN